MHCLIYIHFATIRILAIILCDVEMDCIRSGGSVWFEFYFITTSLISEPFTDETKSTIWSNAGHANTNILHRLLLLVGYNATDGNLIRKFLARCQGNRTNDYQQH